jgi:nucleotide-binding universal stress UspA family protein
MDFSEPSYDGLKVAVEMAKCFSAELILINVIQPLQPVASPGVPTGYYGKDYYEEMAQAAQKSFEEIVKTRVPGEVRVQTKVIEGHPADEIIRETETEKADIIVTATHGWTGWRKFIFGSVAEKVIRLSPVPVITVPPPRKKQ